MNGSAKHTARPISGAYRAGYPSPKESVASTDDLNVAKRLLKNWLIQRLSENVQM
jgi:hypothetical protein